ncbi:hypothetical protein B9Z55_004505 [Caenorhabditis nigoni]|uniref:G-protein coupled receptors family 1 profile domain-containing protein n=1 Tax=Caenorhabditis nigoni TaxID=1611254 RepID=A0A2G5UWU4_9PELO|nr:hypothetical protein B9Z55_004505 [Caenorhabditis nigoni]
MSNLTVPTSATGTACATQEQMIQRTSNLFFNNVYWNILFHVLFFLFSPFAIKKLLKTAYFQTSTVILLISNISFGGLHNLVYLVIQLWSLERSYTYKSDPCSIMFTEYECFPFYRLNILSRLLVMFNYIFLAIDILLNLRNIREPTKARGYVFIVFTFITSVALCAYMTGDGPNGNIMANCLSRTGRDLNELKGQLWIYVGMIVFSFLLNVFSFLMSWSRNKVRQGNVNKTYQNIVNFNSSRFLLITATVSMLIMVVYPTGVLCLVGLVDTYDRSVLGNYVLWVYTYTYASLVLPASLFFYITYIERKRKNQVNGEVKNVEAAEKVQNHHFKDLENLWEVGFEKAVKAGKQPALTPVE